MTKTVQIRDIDEQVYAALKRRAAYLDMSVPEFVRREIARIASRPTPEEWLDRVSQRSSSGTMADVVALLDEHRGPWPDANS